MNFDEPCLTCHYPRGAHRTMQLGWTRYDCNKVPQKVEFWQEGVCPDIHNAMQPSWDVYLFHGADSGSPYEWQGTQFDNVR